MRQTQETFLKENHGKTVAFVVGYLSDLETFPQAMTSLHLVKTKKLLALL